MRNVTFAGARRKSVTLAEIHVGRCYWKLVLAEAEYERARNALHDANATVRLIGPEKYQALLREFDRTLNKRDRADAIYWDAKDAARNALLRWARRTEVGGSGRRRLK